MEECTVTILFPSIFEECTVTIIDDPKFDPEIAKLLNEINDEIFGEV